jgi:hypothetical protein
MNNSKDGLDSHLINSPKIVLSNSEVMVLSRSKQAQNPDLEENDDDDVYSIDHSEVEGSHGKPEEEEESDGHTLIQMWKMYLDPRNLRTAKVEESESEAEAEESKSAVLSDDGNGEEAISLLSSIAPDSALLFFGEGIAIILGIILSNADSCSRKPSNS